MARDELKKIAERADKEFREMYPDIVEAHESGTSVQEVRLRSMGKCILAGATHGANCDDGDGYVVTRRDLNMFVKQRELVVANSENTMAIGAHGRPLLAVRCNRRRGCVVFFEGRDGKCQTRDGTPRELLTPEVRRVMREVFNQEVE
jgi:hypothetical protein